MFSLRGMRKGVRREEKMDYARYLRAKRSVDDRALHAGALSEFAKGLRERAGDTLCIVDVGAGVGAMLPRLQSAGAFDGYVRPCVRVMDAAGDGRSG